MRWALEKRANAEFLVLIDKGDYMLLFDLESRSFKQELDTKTKDKDVPPSLIQGKTAYPGYAKGVAKVLLDEKDFGKFKTGDIIVTGGMTWPTFIPLMKRASGIVTNEGGVTCPAAIAARELEKPCIIGTENATERIKDGDVIEVRATHGTARFV